MRVFTLNLIVTKSVFIVEQRSIVLKRQFHHRGRSRSYVSKSGAMNNSPRAVVVITVHHKDQIQDAVLLLAGWLQKSSYRRELQSFPDQKLTETNFDQQF